MKPLSTKNNIGASLLSLIFALVVWMWILPGTAAASALFLCSQHHTRQFDAWNINPDGTVIKQTTYGLAYASDPAGIAIDNVDPHPGSIIFITSEFSAGIEIVEVPPVGTPNYLGRSPGPSNLAGVAVDDIENVVYSIRRSSNQLYIYDWDTTTETLTQTALVPLPGCSAGFGIALDETKDTLWVADSAAGVARAYEISTWTEMSSVSFVPSHKPVDIAVDRRRQLIYTISMTTAAATPSGTGSHLLSCFDLATRTETTANMGHQGVGVDVDEITGYAYVTGGYYSGNLEVWDASTTPWTKVQATARIGHPAGIVVANVLYNPLNLAKNDIIVGEGVYVGSSFTYEITCDNTSNPTHDAENVTLLDDLPLEVDFLSATHGGVYDPVEHTVFWDIGTIPAGATGPEIELMVIVNDDATPGGTIYNYCTINADGVPPTTVIDQDPCDPGDEPGTPVVEATVVVTVDAPDQVDMGSRYYVYVDITPSQSWQGGWVNLIVDENEVNVPPGNVHADWNIHDNEYWDILAGQWKQRPQSVCYVSVWDIMENKWVTDMNTPYEFGTNISAYVECGLLATHYRFEAYHQWYWVPPWDPIRIIEIIVSIIDPTELINLYLMAEDAMTVLNSQREIIYTYTARAESDVDSDTTMVTITQAKRALLAASLGSGVAGSASTTIGFLLGVVTPPALAAFATEAVLIVAAQGTYIMASDPPDFNYTEVAVPQVPDIAELNQITDPNQHEAAEKALEFAATTVAMRTSLERYDGAKIDGMSQYMALQMGAARFYTQRTIELATWLRDFWCPISTSIPIPTPEEIQEIRENLLQNGLPELEVAILSAFGYSGEEMTEIATTTASLPDEWFTSPETICDALGRLVEGLSLQIQYVPGPEVEIIVPQANDAVQDGVTFTAEVNDVNNIDAVYFYLGEPNGSHGIPVSYQELSAVLDSNSGLWECLFDTTALPDGYYVILAKAVDTYGNIGWSEIVPFSICNGPVVVDELVSIVVGRVGYDRRTGQFSVSVTVTNTSATVINSPVWLVIESISSPSVTVANPDGTTADGKPYLDLSGLLGDAQLDPGETVIKRIYFNNPSRVRFTFEASVRGVILP